MPGRYRALIADSGWVLSLTGLRQLLGLLLVMVLARTVSKADMGHYQFVVAAAGLATIFTLPGLATAVTQAVARGYDGTYLRSVQLVLRTSIGGTLLLASIGAQQAYVGQATLLPALLVAAALFPLSSGLTQWLAYQAGKSQFRTNSIYQGVSYCLSYAAAIAALIWLHAGYLWVIVITTAALAIQNTWVTRSIALRLPAHAPVEAAAIEYGIRTSGYSALNIAGNNIDKFLLFALTTPETLAVYTVAERVPELLKKYLQSASSVLVPGFSRKAGYTRSLDRKINLGSLAIVVAIGIFTIGIVPWLLPLAFTSRYADTVLYCQLLLLTLLVGQSSTTKFAYITSKLDARSFRDITVVSNLVRIGASAALVPWFGIAGAVAATFLYRLVIALIVRHYIHKFHLLADDA